MGYDAVYDSDETIANLVEDVPNLIPGGDP